MENIYTDKDLEKILIEKHEIQKILYPSINPEQNNEKFEGKIYDNKTKKGKYIWQNGQVFIGNLSKNNRFINKGTIIFPNNDKLTGIFNEKDNSITRATYSTSTFKYEGTIKKNKLEGKIIIKNEENMDKYLYIGNYVNGIKNGKFTLERMYNNKAIKVSGAYDKGKKCGIFKIFEENDKEGIFSNEVYSEEFANNFIKSKLIENKEFFEFKEKSKILCVEAFEKDGLYLLLGSYEYLLIYFINLDKKDVYFYKNIFLFFRSEINDIIKLKDGRLLLCSNNNCFKLIKLIFGSKSSNISNLNTTFASQNDCILLQEFKGQANSKNIFSLYEYSSELIVSGDCENIIVWKKNYFNNINENSKESLENESKSMDISMEPSNAFIIIGNEVINLGDYELLFLAKRKTSHTYCMLKIKNNNDKNILAVAQPDSRSIEFLEIQEDEETITKISTILGVDSIPNRKNIMTYYGNNLIVGCKNGIIIIDANKYEIINDIYSNESITFIDSYSDEFLLFGMMKNKEQYEYDGFLSQKILFNNSKGKQNIDTVSNSKKNKFEGNIINSCKYINNNKEYRITIGTDNKILVMF